MVSSIPRHVAIIPDGNRRWAKSKGLAPWEGHKKGYERAIEISREARRLSIKVLTFWGFSTENWKRPPREVEFLMNAFFDLLGRFREDAIKDHVKIIHLGRKDRLPRKLAQGLADLEKETGHFKDYFLCVALDYGGRDEILRSLASLKRGIVAEEEFTKNLDTKDLEYPDPDLIIRTSGEMRLSGLMPWQSVYAELMFIKKNFPDFRKNDFKKCIVEYEKRLRRFGR